jgi:hypothetical protein
MRRITPTDIAGGMNCARGFVSPAMHAGGNNRAPSPTHAEIAARTALEMRADRALTDGEWALMRGHRDVRDVGIVVFPRARSRVCRS